MVWVKEYGEPWIILDYAGCAGLAYFIHVEDDWPDVNALGLLTPARNSSYQHPVIEGTLDENGYAKAAIPIELAAHPLNIVVYPPPDWSSVWFNVSSGLQIIGGISSIALACSATLLTGGAATVLSLGLAAWGANQLMTGVNSLAQQQPHKTLMAQGLEQLGASETYAETLTDVVGFTNATALANLLVKNSAKLGLSTISISLTERKQQVLLNYISLKPTKLNRKFSLRREQLSSASDGNKVVSYKVDYSNTMGDISHLTAEQQLIIKNAEVISTAKPHQATKPRDLNEQILLKKILENPKLGVKFSDSGYNLNADLRFPQSEGFEKLRFSKKLSNGKVIDIHYQYNVYTEKAYDIKIVTPQRFQAKPQDIIASLKDKIK